MTAGIKQLEQTLKLTNTVENLSSIFEIISTFRINKIRTSVLASENFFNVLQHNYLLLRTSKMINTLPKRSFKYNKRVTVIITSAGSFSGPADEQVMDKLFSDKKSLEGDIIVIGRRGIRLLDLKGIKPIMSFDSPDINKPLDVTPLSAIINDYEEARAIYQAFETVSVQHIQEANLIISSISTETLSSFTTGVQLSKENHYFEPSFEEIIKYVESVILNITLSQIIFEAQLSEFANRFKYTSVINDRAKKSLQQLTMKYNSTRRHLKDEVLREQLFQGLVK